MELLLLFLILALIFGVSGVVKGLAWLLLIAAAFALLAGGAGWSYRGRRRPPPHGGF